MVAITPSEQVKRASITKYLMGQYKAPEIRKILEEEYRITTTEDTIRKDIKDILEGKYNLFTDDLLEIHFPKMYEDIVNLVREDIDTLKDIADSTGSEKIRTGATVAHARLSIDFIRVMHQAPVVREMKRLSVMARKLAREVMSNQSMRRPIDVHTESLDIKVITLNENLEKINEEIIPRINVERDENPKGPDEN